MAVLGTGRFALLGAVLTLAVPMTMISDTAQAWKLTTHVYFAERALDDAKDGKVTISSVDYETGKVVDAITPKALQAAIKKLKDKAFDRMLQAAIGMNKAEPKKLMTNPQNYFNSVMGSGNGEKISLANFNAKYLKIADKGYSNLWEAFDYRQFTAGHNTV